MKIASQPNNAARQIDDALPGMGCSDPPWVFRGLFNARQKLPLNFLIKFDTSSMVSFASIKQCHQGAGIKEDVTHLSESPIAHPLFPRWDIQLLHLLY